MRFAAQFWGSREPHFESKQELKSGFAGYLYQWKAEQKTQWIQTLLRCGTKWSPVYGRGKPPADFLQRCYTTSTNIPPNAACDIFFSFFRISLNDVIPRSNPDENLDVSRRPSLNRKPTKWDLWYWQTKKETLWLTIRSDSRANWGIMANFWSIEKQKMWKRPTMIWKWSDNDMYERFKVASHE